jgi:hypothetical protein
VIDEAHEVPLARAEVDKILSVCGSTALLVGGQALAIWAEFFQIEPTGVLSEKITADIDFIAPKSVANRLSLVLKWRLYLPTFEDSTSQTAKVATTLPDGGVKQVDFLSSIVGLVTAKIQERASELELPIGSKVRILSPLDVLESRLRNLDILSSKQNAVGIAQAELAIAVVGKFFDFLISSDRGVRGLLDAVKRVTQIAFDRRLAQVCFKYDLNPLSSIPAEKIESESFQSKRWPQILARANKLRQEQTKLQTRAVEKSRSSPHRRRRPLHRI